jgi:hypothetical protein
MASALIRARVCETVLVGYGTTPRQGEYVALTPEYADDFERPFGICFPVGLYALCAQRHMYEYGTFIDWMPVWCRMPAGRSS